MSGLQSAFCRSAPWRAAARHVVLPWALHGFEPHGDVLEIGAGSGAMAVEVLATCPDVRMTATDFDEDMVTAAGERLARFGRRARTRVADATALPFEDGSFDCVVSFVMLHHTLDWERALAEAVRVLRPGGTFAGYDLLSTPAIEFLQRNHGDHLRFMTLRELRDVVRELPVEASQLGPALGGAVVRFSLRKLDAGRVHASSRRSSKPWSSG